MKTKLKELLNKLIEKGRVPFGDKRITNVNGKMQHIGTYNWVFWSNHNLVEIRKSTRELVSKESGLWQFVCENGMVGRGDRMTKRKKVKDTDSRSGEEVIYYSVIGSYNETDYQYRLIEASLKDESELEQFLLDNIKVE